MTKSALTLLVLLCSSAAIPSGAYVLVGDVIDGGGTKMTSSGYVLRGSVAQPTIGKIAGGNYVAHIGFWHPPYGAAPGIEEELLLERLVPRVYSLSQNFPNPVVSRTTIGYSLPREAFVQVKVYNSSGQEIRTLVNENQAPGFYRITWDLNGVSGNDLANGVYFYRIVTRDFTSTRKMVILR